MTCTQVYSQERVSKILLPCRAAFRLLRQLFWFQRRNAQIERHVHKPLDGTHRTLEHRRRCLNSAFESQDSRDMRPCMAMHHVRKAYINFAKAALRRRWCHSHRCRTCRRKPSWHLGPRPGQQSSIDQLKIRLHKLPVALTWAGGHRDPKGSSCGCLVLPAQLLRWCCNFRDLREDF